MEMNIKHVHVGAEIEKRRVELGLSKSELGRRIGVPQQHVNRILERETMETNRLVKVSELKTVILVFGKTRMQRLSFALWAVRI